MKSKQTKKTEAKPHIHTEKEQMKNITVIKKCVFDLGCTF